MGLSDTIVVVIAFSLTLAAAGHLGEATFDSLETLRDAAETRREMDQARIETRLGNANATYDGGNATLVVTIVNLGERAINLSEATVVVDGEPQMQATARVLGASSGSDVWFPGESVDFAVGGLDSVPQRIVVVTGGGATEFLVGDLVGVVGTGGTTGVRFVEGAGGANPQYFHDYDVSDDGAAFRGVFKPKSGANTTVKDVVRITNTGASSRTIVLSGDPLVSSQVQWANWTIRTASAGVGSLNYRDATPQATFSLAAGSTVLLDLTLHLREGSDAFNSRFHLNLQMEAT